jgi:TrmH family RNA methyltransferase
VTPLKERYRSARNDPSLVVLEGLHALKHALRFGADVIDVRTHSPGELRDLARELAPDVTDRTLELAQTVDRQTFDELAPSPHPTGVIALARRPHVSVEELLAAPGPAPIVVLERPTHHGNIGAVIRVAAAGGAAGVLVTGRHDPWHPSSIRGAAGLQFALPVAALAPAGLAAVVESDRPVIALDPAGEPLVAGGPAGADRPGTGADPADDGPATDGPAADADGEDALARIPPRSVLVFGSERTGVTAEVLDRADQRIAIPMRRGVSSLNLATAVAVTLYVGS